MIETVHGGQLVAEHMGRPVLRHACANQAVQRLGGRPHNIGANVVVFRLFQRFRAVFHQGQQNTFGKAVLDFAVNRIGDVLLNGMDECVNDAVSHLARRQGVGVNRIQNSEHRLDVGGHKRAFVAGGFTRDHRAFIGFGTGRRQRQHGAHRDSAGHFAAVGFENFPRIDTGIVVGRRGDEFSAVENGAAAHRQQESDLFITRDFHRVHQRFVGRVWLDAAKFPNVNAVQRAQNLIKHAGFLHATAAVGDKHACIRRDLIAQIFNRAFTEQNAGWGM